MKNGIDHNKTNVLLCCFSYNLAPVIPYASACLISTALKHEELAEHYNFLTPEHEEHELNSDMLEHTDILGLTNYVWNQSINDSVARAYKLINPEGIVIYGGPNVPEDVAIDPDYLEQRKEYVDVFFTGPGEESFTKFLYEFKEGKRTDFDLTFGDGWENKRMIDRRDYVIDQDNFPYLDGILDHYLEQDDAKLMALVEGSRGCPFKCAFCDWGSMTRARVQKFTHQGVLDTLEKVVKAKSTKTIYFTDANFGMHAEDLEYIKHLIALKRKYKRAFLVDVSYAKNVNKYIPEIIRLIDEHLSIPTRITKRNAKHGIQSHTPEVLDVIDRNNIKPEKFIDLHRELEGWNHTNELILGMPGETPESWLDNFQKEVDIGSKMTRAHKLRVLVNTPMNMPDYRERYNIKSRKFRVPYEFEKMDCGVHHKKRDASLYYRMHMTDFIEFDTIVSCYSFDTEQLKEIWGIWWWFSLLSNSKFAYKEMRELGVPIAEQYTMFKMVLPDTEVFSRIWNWHETIFNDIFYSEDNNIRSLEHVKYFATQPKFLAEVYLNIDQAIDEMRAIYPTLNRDGLIEIPEKKMGSLYNIDSEIRKL